MTTGATVLRSVAWREEPVRVLPRGRADAVSPAASPDAVRLGYEEGLRRGLEQGREQGIEAGVGEGHAAGLATGLSEGRRQAQEELRRALADMRGEADQQQARVALLATGLEEAVSVAVAAAEDGLVVLCLQALCRIVGPAFATPEGVRAQVARLLAEHDPAAAVAVHLHPADMDLLDRAVLAGGRPNVSWVADDKVDLGGCIVQAAAQTIDARLEVVFDAFKAALLEGRARHLDAKRAATVQQGDA
jgi:flagellar assembly protein FliH